VGLAGAQAARIEEQDRRLAEQDQQIEALRLELDRLRRVLTRNSGNSSLPPSGDDVPGRRRPERGGSGRRRGKQPGADGSALRWVADADAVAHFPQGACGCGADLAGAADLGVARSHQVHDVPLVTVTVTQHDLHRVRCRCGRTHVAARPGGVAGCPSSYGANLRALVVYLLLYQHVPVERCAWLVADLTGARPSAGFVHGMLARAAAAVAEVVDLVKTAVTVAHVAGFDETTLRCGAVGKKRYVLSASTELFTVFGLGGRDLGSFTDFDVLGRFAGIAVHDRYSLYDHPDFGVAAHQLCVAHILRDIQDAAETYPDHHWPAQASRALRGLVGAWHDARAAPGQPRVPAEIADPLILQLRRAVRVGLSQIPRAPGANTKQPPGRMLLECLRDREPDALRFCFDTRVWPTNNISERDLRPHKTQQKISGRLTCEDTTRDRLTIRSYISTARKHGINIMTALHQAILGNPWIPPTLVNT
jgi:transposase